MIQNWNWDIVFDSTTDIKNEIAEFSEERVLKGFLFSMKNMWVLSKEHQNARIFKEKPKQF